VGSVGQLPKSNDLLVQINFIDLIFTSLGARLRDFDKGVIEPQVATV
jgi:hypothetical protein